MLHKHFRLSALANIAELEDKADQAWMRGDYKAADAFAEQAQAKKETLT